MNSFNATQNARQASRLQNTQKTGLGNGNAGTNWAFGAPASFGGITNNAPGLAARPGQLSGFAQVMGGGGAHGPIDMSDFPTLSGAPRPQPAPSTPSGTWNSSAIRQAPAGHLAQHQQGQMAQLSSSSQTLGGQNPSQTNGPLSSFQGPLSNPQARGPLPSQTLLENEEARRRDRETLPDLGQPVRRASRERQGRRKESPQSGLAGGDASTSAAQEEEQGSESRKKDGRAANAEQKRGARGANATGRTVQSTARQASDAGRSRYTLTGLETLLAGDVARSGNVGDEQAPQQEGRAQALLMGQEVSSATMSMDLESPDPLYPTFSVFGDLYDGSDSAVTHRHPIPDFVLSESYAVNNVPPLLPRMSAMSDETLFFVFYQNPRGLEQEQAGIELHARFWRWHKVLRKWLQKDTREANAATTPLLIDLTNGAPVDGVVSRPSQNTERGVFIFFEPTPHWRRERREFTLNYEELDHRQGGNAAAAATAVVDAKPMFD